MKTATCYNVNESRGCDDAQKDQVTAIRTAVPPEAGGSDQGGPSGDLRVTGHVLDLDLGGVTCRMLCTETQAPSARHTAILAVLCAPLRATLPVGILRPVCCLTGRIFQWSLLVCAASWGASRYISGRLLHSSCQQP